MSELNEKKLKTFEECYDIINQLLETHRSKWHIAAIPSIDFDDVKQIIKVHIWKKWHLYEQHLPLEPWANRIIINQLRNLRRNVLDAFSRPCLKCAENEGNDLCRAFVKQCNSCPLYAKWEKRKKRAYNLKLPLPLENHIQEVHDISENTFNLDSAIEEFHKQMLRTLKPVEKRVYIYLYIKGLTQDEVCREMGWVTNEGGRKPGYNNFIRINKLLIEKAKIIVKKIDF